MTKRRHPTITSLIALESFVRTGSVSAAAEDLSVTHGAVSKQLTQLEERMGVDLFRQRRRGMAVNAHGERLAAAVREALSLVEQAVDDILESDPPEVLTVVAPATFAMRWLIPQLPALSLERCKTAARVRPTHTTEDWDALEYDVIVRRGEPLAERLSPRHLFTEELGLFAAPSLALPASPARAPFVDAATRRGELQRWCHAAFGGTPEQPPKVYPHFYVAMEAALAGLGAIIAPVELILPQVEQGKLAEPWPAFRVTGARYCVGVAPDSRNRRAADALADAMISQYKLGI